MKDDEFFSVVIPHFTPPSDEHAKIRVDYLRQAIESIHAQADMPFEIIVHDDTAYREMTYQFKDRVSTIVHNYGKNFGLAESANRAISVASSNNILFINDDIIMTKRCLKTYKTILERPYVGMIGIYGEPPQYFSENDYILRYKDVPFFLTGGVGGCAAMVFRKDFWQEVGGFARVDSGRSDTVIPFKAWRAGYFRARAVGSGAFRNLSAEKKNVDTTLGPYKELHMPKLFRITDRDYNAACDVREKEWQRYGKVEEFKEEGLCLTPDTLVETTDGYREIQSIKIGDSVFTHIGAPNRVTNKLERNYDGKIVVVAPYYSPPVALTPEHPCLTSRGWVLAKEITENDELFIPNELENVDTKIIDILKFTTRRIDSGSPKGMLRAVASHGNYIPRFIPFNVKLMRFFGYYVSEGHCTDKGVVFSFGLHEKELHSDLISIVREIFGLTMLVNERPDTNSIQFVLNNVLVGDLLSSFGRKSYEKKIPEFLRLSNDIKMIEHFYGAYLAGDGCVSDRLQVLANTSSPTLAMHLRKIGLRMKIPIAIGKPKWNPQVIRGKKVKCPHLSFPIREIVTGEKGKVRFDKNGMFVKIRNIEERVYVGKVYNLEVERNHSYNTIGFSVHNCNLNYWHNYTYQIVPDYNPCNINWEYARKYGQIKWKGEVLTDAFRVTKDAEEYLRAL